jgi:hypothetical protein
VARVRLIHAGQTGRLRAGSACHQYRRSDLVAAAQGLSGIFGRDNGDSGLRLDAVAQRGVRPFAASLRIDAYRSLGSFAPHASHV